MGSKKNKAKKNKNGTKRIMYDRVSESYSIYNLATQSAENANIYYIPFSNDFSAVLPCIKGMPGDLISDYIKNSYIKVTKNGGFEGDLDSYAITVKEFVEVWFNYAMSNCVDVPQEMNILSAESQKAVIDRIDIREYMNENGEYPQIALDGISCIQEIGDIGALWSTNQFVDLIISDSIFVRMYRDGYNAENGSIKYIMDIHTKFRLTDNVCINIPTCRHAFEIGLTGERVIPSRKYPNPNNLGILEVDIKSRNGIKVYETKRGLTPYFRPKGTILFSDIASYLAIKRKWEDDSGKLAMIELLKRIDLDRSFSKQVLVANRKISNIESVILDLALYAIVLANKYIKEKKVSRPHTKYDIKIGEFEPTERPDRKRRILGNLIKMDSEESPQVLTVERIINFHVTEWGRKAHLRHMKDGRVIEVKASQCKRKCSEAVRKTKVAKLQATDYSIKNS